MVIISDFLINECQMSNFCLIILPNSILKCIYVFLMNYEYICQMHFCFLVYFEYLFVFFNWQLKIKHNCADDCAMNAKPQSKSTTTIWICYMRKKDTIEFIHYAVLPNRMVDLPVDRMLEALECINI